MRKFTFYIDNSLIKKLREKAKAKGLSLSGYIRMVLIENVEKTE